MLSCWKWREEEEEEESHRLDDLAILATCQFSTIVMLSIQVNGPVAHTST